MFQKKPSRYPPIAGLVVPASAAPLHMYTSGVTGESGAWAMRPETNMSAVDRSRLVHRFAWSKFTPVMRTAEAAVGSDPRSSYLKGPFTP